VYEIILSRSWLEAANNEKYTRGPCCFIQVYKTRNEFLSEIKNIRIKPSIGFFFIPENTPRNIEGIHFVFVYIIYLF